MISKNWYFTDKIWSTILSVIQRLHQKSKLKKLEGQYQWYLHVPEWTRGSLQAHHMQVVCQSASKEWHIEKWWHLLRKIAEWKVAKDWVTKLYNYKYKNTYNSTHRSQHTYYACKVLANWLITWSFFIIAFYTRLLLTLYVCWEKEGKRERKENLGAVSPP